MGLKRTILGASVGGVLGWTLPKVVDWLFDLFWELGYRNIYAILGVFEGLLFVTGLIISGVMVSSVGNEGMEMEILPFLTTIAVGSLVGLVLMTRTLG